MALSENTIIHRFASGSEAVFQEIYRKYVRRLRFFANKYLPDREQAEDVLQEAFISLWENRSRISNEASLKSFLYTGVRNRCLNILRHEETRRKYAGRAIPGEEADFTADVVETELYDMVRRVFEELPPASRQVYRMSLEGKKYTEIAEELGISINTVKKYKNNANKYMRGRFGDINFYSILLF